MGVESNKNTKVSYIHQDLITHIDIYMDSHLLTRVNGKPKLSSNAFAVIRSVFPAENARVMRDGLLFESAHRSNGGMINKHEPKLS